MQDAGDVEEAAGDKEMDIDSGKGYEVDDEEDSERAMPKMALKV